jgi:hypothetical protein
VGGLSVGSTGEAGSRTLLGNMPSSISPSSLLDRALADLCRSSQEKSTLGIIRHALSRSVLRNWNRTTSSPMAKSNTPRTRLSRKRAKAGKFMGRNGSTLAITSASIEYGVDATDKVVIDCAWILAREFVV